MITDTQVEQVLTQTLEEPPPNHDSHWSTRSMAKATAISRIWRGVRAQPHLQQAWKLSTDPQFIDKVRDIVGRYLDPPAAALVLWVDEKSQSQALDRTAPSLPILPEPRPGAATTMCATAPPACSPPWMWPAAR